MTRHDDFLAGVPEQFDVWMSHGDQVSRVSDDLLPLAETATCPIAAVKHRSLPVFGVQFHPEVTHTPLGSHMLHNFVTAVCGCTGTWKLGDFAKQSIEQMRERIGKRPRDLRPVGRRRFGGDGGAALSGDRPAAFVHPGR